MGSHSGTRRGRHDDPYTFDDPYLSTTSPREASFEYVGTDEPLSPGGRAPDNPEPPRHTFSREQEPKRRPSPTRRYSRTTSPPRRSRHHHDKHHSPPRNRRQSPSVKSSRHHSPHRRHSKREKEKEKEAAPTKLARYREFAQRPAVQRTKTYGRQGLHFLGEAAAAYAAAQQGGGGGDGRGRSLDRYDFYDPEPVEPPRRSRHRRRHTPSPSPSPSPSPHRRRSRRGDPPRDRDRPRMGERLKSYSTSPPRRGRDVDSVYDSDQSRHHRRHKRRTASATRSVSPPRRHGRARSATTNPGFRSSLKREHYNMPEKANAERWQMAARAALEAGGLTAFRLRKEPGSWAGEKGAKIATAALGAAAIDAFIDKDPRHARSKGGMKGMAENAVTSMIASQLMGFKGSSKGGKSRY
ncbi:hypothetical protein F5Y15DRAFT_32307 [Xylariaceae sp. FL0016]|nr:hypothetical protein F5Y15DRAFT_32307 [Xylariaceae sp. FL0016]